MIEKDSKQGEEVLRHKMSYQSNGPLNLMWMIQNTISVLIMVTVYDSYSGSHDKLDL